MRWLRRRDLGEVDAIFVQVWPPGERVGRRTVKPGRVILTYEDARGRVIVEADQESMAAMLGQARDQVLALIARRRQMWARLAAPKMSRLEAGCGGEETV